MAAQSSNQNASAVAPPTASKYFLNPLVTLHPSSGPITGPHPEDVFLVCQTRQPLWTDSFMGYTVISRHTVMENLTHICCACPTLEIAIRELHEAADAYRNHPNIANIPRSTTSGSGDLRDEISFCKDVEEYIKDVEGHITHKVEDFMARFHIIGSVHMIR
jgi:hypothetical protein